jgi:hypothetical protein
MALVLTSNGKTDIKSFLEKNTAVILHTLFKESETVDSSKDLWFKLSMSSTVMNVTQTEPRIFNEETILSDYIALQRQLTATQDNHVDLTLTLIIYHEAKCEGCRNKHPSQEQHMGSFGCLSSSWN